MNIKELLGTYCPFQRRKIYSIGLYGGVSPLNLHPVSPRAVLTAQKVTDVKALYVADPFLIRRGSRFYLFFEVWDRRVEKGKIGLATSEDGFVWTYEKIVLAEPFHLSYPYVFEWQGSYYMLPESRQSGEVRLYKAIDFPLKWSFFKILRAGYYVDASILRHDDKWWLFTATGEFHDNLCLYYASALEDQWVEHPRNPVVKDGHSARPAGRIVTFDSRIVRFGQDDFPVYGLRVKAFEITRLTDSDYREEALSSSALLQGSGHGWNADGMHHIDTYSAGGGRWIAVVDGWARKFVYTRRDRLASRG